MINLRAMCPLVVIGSLAVVHCRPPLEARAQSRSEALHLELHLEKDTFLEDEPIYYMLKLTNISREVQWVSPFTMWSDQVLFRFVHEPGEDAVPRGGLHLDKVYGETVRGDSLLPGASFYHSSHLSYHGERGPHYGFTAYRTLRAGGYRLEVTYLSDFRGAVFGEGDAEPISAHTTLRVVRRPPSEEREFQEVLALFQRLGTFEESGQNKMSARAVREALRTAETFVASHARSPFSPLVYGNFLGQAGVRAEFAKPPLPASEIRSAVERTRSIAASQAPASLSRLHLVLCEPNARRAELLAQVNRIRSEGSAREARIAQAILEFVEWADPLDHRPSVHQWGQICD